MRIYWRRAVSWALAMTIGIILTVNVYNMDRWTEEPAYLPWTGSLKPSWERRHVQRQVHQKWAAGGKFHAHVIEQKVRQAADIATKHRKEAQNAIEALFSKEPRIWPDPKFENDDRIVAQMKYVPRNLRSTNSNEKRASRIILLYTGMGGWDVTEGQQTFVNQKCSVDTCYLTDNREFSETADVILFKQGISRPNGFRPPHQSWVLYLLESPYHTPALSSFRNAFNWTATYRHDSTIVTPYEKFVPYNYSVLTKEQTHNYAEGKTKKVAWFVSNCNARNGRKQFAQVLSQHIQVDIYGACGPLKCPRFHADQCFQKLDREYKFYLAFENSNCRDYITEKFFVNGLQHNVIPIVMGAAPEDYQRAAPPHSYIHVEDYDTPKDLADYLHLLDTNDDLYNEYFKWKGTGEFINTYFWCRLCALAHDTSRQPSWFDNAEEWWRGEGVCIANERWTEYHKRIAS